MLKVYRGWIITPISEKNLVAQKNGRAIMGEWEEIVPKIDKYELEKEIEEVKNE